MTISLEGPGTGIGPKYIVFAAGTDDEEDDAGPSTREPHFPQNLKSAGTSLPQVGQVLAPFIAIPVQILSRGPRRWTTRGPNMAEFFDVRRSKSRLSQRPRTEGRQ